MRWLFQIYLCLFCLGAILYALVAEQNKLNELRREVPKLSKKWNSLQKENDRLCYQIDEFLNPQKLLILSQKKEFGYLRFPKKEEVSHFKEPPPLEKDLKS